MDSFETHDLNARRREMWHYQKEKRLAEGLCTKCGKHKHLANVHYCTICAEKGRKAAASRYKRRKRDRICIDCLELVNRAGILCTSCLRKREQLRQTRIAKGLCRNCGAAKGERYYGFCESCRKDHVERNRLYIQKKRRKDN